MSRYAASRLSIFSVAGFLLLALAADHAVAEPERSLMAQATPEEAELEASKIIQQAQEEAARIRNEAMKHAAEIEAEATRNAAQIEADAILNAARQSAQAAPPAPAPQSLGGVRVRGDRYPDINGQWKWESNARNRKFEIKAQPDGTVDTKLYKSVRTRHYREDLRYEGGKLTGNTYQILKTPTGTDTKRQREFRLEISEDGNRLEGYLKQWDEKGNNDEETLIVWKRLR